MAKPPMTSDQFKEAAYKLIDMAADYMDNIESYKPLPHVKPGWLAQIMPPEAPQQGESFDAIFGDIEKIAFEGIAHWQHPQFASYFPSGNSWPSILSEIISNTTAVNGTNWNACPVVTELELIMADWVAKMIGLPDFFWTFYSKEGNVGGGCIQTSASDAILLGMLSAREDCVKALKEKEPDTPRAVLLNKMVGYRSSQCHSSVERAGLIGNMRIRALPADELGNVRARTLIDAIEADLADGLVPFLYVAVLGSTGICAFDDLMEVGPVTTEYKMWLHVDMAYAGSCMACPEMRYLMKGMDYANSTNINMNKWMLCNFDLSWLWLKDCEKLAGPMAGYDECKYKTADYPLINLKYFGTPSTRRLRAIKMWFVVRNYGVTGLQTYHRNHILMSKIFERYVERDERFEVVGPTRVGLCCFRLRGTNDINNKMLEAINASRRLHMVPSYFHEAFVIRYVPCYQYLSECDIDMSWCIVDEFATAIIHKYKAEGIDSDVHKTLYELQDYYDERHKKLADDEWDKEEQEAETFVQSHEHETIVDVLFNTTKDGSYGENEDDADDEYDQYLHQHPEIYEQHEILGEPKLESKVPSMLRMEGRQEFMKE